MYHDSCRFSASILAARRLVHSESIDYQYPRIGPTMRKCFCVFESATVVFDLVLQSQTCPLWLDDWLLKLRISGPIFKKMK